MGLHNHSGTDFAISEGYPKKLISYANEALSLDHSLILSVQIIYKWVEYGNTVECGLWACPDKHSSLHMLTADERVRLSVTYR